MRFSCGDFESLLFFCGDIWNSGIPRVCYSIQVTCCCIHVNSSWWRRLLHLFHIWLPRCQLRLEAADQSRPDYVSVNLQKKKGWEEKIGGKTYLVELDYSKLVVHPVKEKTQTCFTSTSLIHKCRCFSKNEFLKMLGYIQRTSMFKQKRLYFCMIRCLIWEIPVFFATKNAIILGGISNNKCG